MKIQQTSGTPLDAVTPKGKTTPSAIDFQKLLTERVQALSPVGPTTAVSAVAAVAATSPALRIEALGLTEKTIATLESYQDALRDGTLQPAHLEPFIEAMEEETLGLIGLREQIPADDPLGRLLDRAASASYVEAAKFRRGDYHA